MNPLLEVNPDACIVVVGPQLSRTCLHVVPESVKLTYSSLILSGLEMVRSDERGRLEELYQVSSDGAAEEICSLLKSLGHFESWITSNAGTPCSCTHRQSPLLQLLLELHSQGCRLVYTHYDNILDVAAGMIPILPTNADHLDQWIDGQLKGFLHLHGHYSDVDSLILHTSAYDSILSSWSCFTKLKDIFKRRTVIFIGHDPNHLNPLLVKMTKTFLRDDTETIRNPPLLVSSMAPPVPSCFLHLPVTRLEEENFHLFMTCGPETSFVIGRTSEKQVDKEIIRSQAVLIFSEKQSFRKLGDIIYQLNQSGEIYVRRDALTILFGSKIMYGNILTYGGCGLRRIWELSVPPGSVLRGKGLIAVGLQNALMIWINKKPVNLGPITEVNTFHSLWNNSAAAMKSQPHAATCSSSPITSCNPTAYSPTVITPNTTNTTTWPLSLIPPTLPYPLAAYRPIFPVLSSPLIPVDRTLVSSVTSSQLPPPRPVLANLPYHIYSGIPPGGTTTEQVDHGLKLDSTSSRQTSMSESSDKADSSITVSESMTGGSIVDVDNSRDSMSEEETFYTRTTEGGAVYLMAEPPVLLQEVILEKLKNSEHEIVTKLNPIKQMSTDSQQTPPISMTALHPPLPSPPTPIITSDSASSSNSNSGSFTGTSTSPSVTVKSVPLTQVQPIIPIQSIQRPTVPPLPPLLASSFPMAAPVAGIPSTLQYPFAISPYSFFPSLLQQGNPHRQPEYLFRVLQSNTMASSMPSVVPIMTPPTVLPSVSSNNVATAAVLSSIIPQMQSNMGTLNSFLLPHQLKILSEGTSNQLATNSLSGSISQPIGPKTTNRSENEISEMNQGNSSYEIIGTSQVHTVSGDHDNSNDGHEMIHVDSHDEEEEEDSSSKSMHLWEFILHLLLTPNHGNLIQWTGDNYEFTIIDPAELTTAWCSVSNSGNRNFNTLLGTLRSYSGLGILEPIQDKKLTYTFVMDIQRYMSLYGQTLISFRKNDDDDD